MKFTIYEVDSGKIICNIDYPESSLDLNVQSGQSAIMDWFSPDQFFIEDGAAIAMPEKPGEWAEFDYVTKVWFDPRTAEDIAAELGAAQAEAIRLVNAAIGAIRSTMVTVIPAQDMLYQAKETEAKAYLNDPDPQAFDYPLITAEVGITADDAYQVAQVYVNQAIILRQMAAQLESVRLGHIAAIEAATNIQVVELTQAAFDAVIEAMAA